MTSASRRQRRWIRIWRSRVTTVVAAFRVFSTPADALRFLRLKRTRARGRPRVALRLRALDDGTVWVRPGTTDTDTIWNTFFHGYHLPPDDLPMPEVIVDLGANVGYTCCHFAALYPTARIIGLELDRENFELARANTAQFGDRCHVEHAAVWTEDGEVSYSGAAEDAFHVAPRQGTDALPHRKAPAWSLSTVFERFGLDLVDYLKMDIEGAERPLLEVGGCWLPRVRALKVELHRGLSPDHAAAILSSHGFVTSVDERHWACVVAWRPDSLAQG